MGSKKIWEGSLDGVLGAGIIIWQGVGRSVFTV
jgi:hypothetical protein